MTNQKRSKMLASCGDTRAWKKRVDKIDKANDKKMDIDFWREFGLSFLYEGRRKSGEADRVGRCVLIKRANL